ncbi:lipopolysaccharide assembly protein LapA domain-containing protein [Pseudomonas sp.]|uniref:lipopolysaccharide assembly protein LapA domain-containing protein n=1 Tax=Pseudomonas sp. TaxID=306 RepID=UPI003CC5569C
MFILENQQPAGLTLLGWGAPQLPVSILIIIALLAGMLIGPAIGLYLASQKVRAYRRRSISSG